MALVDENGEPLLTYLHHGCPNTADYNGDGINDIILGGQHPIGKVYGTIFLIPNTGTNQDPVFNFLNGHRVKGGGEYVYCHTG